jgi:hypothetical protein
VSYRKNQYFTTKYKESNYSKNHDRNFRKITIEFSENHNTKSAAKKGHFPQQKRTPPSSKSIDLPPSLSNGSPNPNIPPVGFSVDCVTGISSINIFGVNCSPDWKAIQQRNFEVCFVSSISRVLSNPNPVWVRL